MTRPMKSRSELTVESSGLKQPLQKAGTAKISEDELMMQRSRKTRGTRKSRSTLIVKSSGLKKPLPKASTAKISKDELMMQRDRKIRGTRKSRSTLILKSSGLKKPLPKASTAKISEDELMMQRDRKIRGTRKSRITLIVKSSGLKKPRQNTSAPDINKNMQVVQRPMQEVCTIDQASMFRTSKQSNYSDAFELVPSPPKRPRIEKRNRVSVPKETKNQLDEWLMGLFLSSTDRLEFLKSLPLVATTLALPPTLDDDLRPISGHRKLYNCLTEVSEKELFSLHEINSNALNLLALVKKLALEQPELTPKMSGYLDLIGDLMSVSMQDITGLRRKLALEALGLKEKDIPSVRTLPLDGSTRLDVKLDEYSPNLFGSGLKEEVLAADSAVEKSIGKLKQRRFDLRKLRRIVAF